jgi:hypothetical protein
MEMGAGEGKRVVSKAAAEGRCDARVPHCPSPTFARPSRAPSTLVTGRLFTWLGDGDCAPVTRTPSILQVHRPLTQSAITSSVLLPDEQAGRKRALALATRMERPHLRRFSTADSNLTLKVFIVSSTSEVNWQSPADSFAFARPAGPEQPPPTPVGVGLLRFVPGAAAYAGHCAAGSQSGALILAVVSPVFAQLTDFGVCRMCKA